MKDFEIKTLESDLVPGFHHYLRKCLHCGIDLKGDMLDSEAEDHGLIVYNCSCGLRFQVEFGDTGHEIIHIIRKG